MILIGPRTTKNMTELFHEKKHGIIPNTNHFSVSLLILSLFFIPELPIKLMKQKFSLIKLFHGNTERNYGFASGESISRPLNKPG